MNRTGRIRFAVLIAGAAILGSGFPIGFARSATGVTAGAGFLVGVPQGEFSDNVEDPGYGLSLFGTYRVPKSPIQIGLDFGFLLYGREERTEPFNPNIPDVEVEVVTENSIVTGHAVGRFQPWMGTIRPYADGVLGFNYLSTTTKVQDEDSDEEIASSTNQDDGAFTYGGGGGLMIRLYDAAGKNASGKGLQSVLLDLQVRYVAGGEAEYLREGSVRRESGRVVYELNKSRTDLMTYCVGVALEF